ncbi:hypothetical protein [Desulfosarcina sp.]|uniref:hypothetical protein n=1 Tax=Desulfosarcina sp. TaxID=2027861 RepID=UPI0035686AB0
MQPKRCSDQLTGGRRMGGDRREYSYACCLPERRSGLDRRSGRDRRQQSRISSMMVNDDETATTAPRQLLAAMV